MSNTKNDFSLLKIKGNYQVTLPVELRKKYKMGVGDYVKAVAQKDGIILVPIKIIDSSQEWVWDEKWQKNEQEAAQDIRKGKVSAPFSNRTSLTKHLKKIRSQAKKK